MLSGRPDRLSAPIRRMSKFFVFVATMLSLLAIGLAGFAYYQVWVDQPLNEIEEYEHADIGDVADVKAVDGDVLLDLTPRDEGGNTQLVWRCGKVLAGMRSDYAGAWTSLRGKALIDGKARTLRAGELHVAVNAMRGHGASPAPNAMINTVRENQWFDPDHPTAILKIARVTPRSGENQATADSTTAIADWTHVLEGSMVINGVDLAFTTCARVEVGEQTLQLDATVPISREAYQVQKRQGLEPPSAVDDQVVVDVQIRAAPDPSAVIADLNRELVSQQATSGLLAEQVKALTARLDRMEASQSELQRELQSLKAAGVNGGSKSAVDVSALPARFTDYVDYENERGDENVVDLGFSAEFEMVLIPGDAEKGISPFYAQTTEVTWDMFQAWSYCTDLLDPTYAAKLKEELLRPTPCYEDASRGHGFDGRAVLGVSRRNAEAFCKHVSTLTGRPYRLWTDAEWRYVAEATGGVPEDLHEVAWLDGNCPEDEWGAKLTMPVGKKPANKFGLFDFWGNVAEWVMADEVFIRGGSYLVKKGDLTMDWRETESQDIWNETYPNLPKSLWWYRDRFDMGFRLVCDPVNIPEAK